MKNTSFSKYHASSSIEDLSDQPSHYQHNWLLTYLDVFVLIIMLVITLMSLKEFESERQFKEQQRFIEKSVFEKEQILKRLVTMKHDVSKKTPLIVQPGTTQTPVIKEQTHQKPVIEEKRLVNGQKSNKTKLVKKSNKNKLQEHLTKKIKELGLNNAVDLKVTLGYAQLEIQDKILFQSSEATLLDDGKILLKKLAPLLAESLGLIFIEGHTDDLPIKTEKFPSNWELGATRATNVLRYLITQDIDALRLRAMSSAATKPIADNNTPEGRDKNRRVSIMIQVANEIN